MWEEQKGYSLVEVGLRFMCQAPEKLIRVLDKIPHLG